MSGERPDMGRGSASRRFRAAAGALCLLAVSFSPSGVAGEPGAEVPAPEKVPPPPPYVFSLGGLKPDEIDGLKEVPGVEKVEAADGRTRVVWQPYNDEPWGTRKKWIKGAERMADFIAVKGVSGKTQYARSGPGAPRKGPIILDTRGQVTLSVKFADVSGKEVGNLSLRCYSQTLPGQIAHEMLRNAPGTKVSVEKCGDGYVVVSGGSRGTFVVWQVSDQMFVRIDNVFDREMVAAYVNRLGSVTPKDCTVTVDGWVRNEIRWRIGHLDAAFARDAAAQRTRAVNTYGGEIAGVFPQVESKRGLVDVNGTIADTWDWQNWVRNWLWANVGNFKYDDESRRYVLKGKDLYDPKNPPELPEDLRGPPRPAADKEPAATTPGAPTEVPAGK
jgi:hypothetical protein